MGERPQGLQGDPGSESPGPKRRRGPRSNRSPGAWAPQARRCGAETPQLSAGGRAVLLGAVAWPAIGLARPLWMRPRPLQGVNRNGRWQVRPNGLQLRRSPSTRSSPALRCPLVITAPQRERIRSSTRAPSDSSGTTWASWLPGIGPAHCAGTSGSSSPAAKSEGAAGRASARSRNQTATAARAASPTLAFSLGGTSSLKRDFHVSQSARIAAARALPVA